MDSSLIDENNQVKTCMSNITNNSSKSTSKLKNVSDYIWSKLTSSRKNSSLNISKTQPDCKILSNTCSANTNSSSLIETTESSTNNLSNQKNEKKHRRNLFNIFDSTSKIKINSGANKKNTKNKNASKKISTNSSSIQEDTSPVEEKKDVKKVDEIVEPEIESIKANLIDNSMVKSKIQAAARRNNLRNRPTSSGSSSSISLMNSSLKMSLSKLSMSSLSQKMDVIDEVANNEGNKLIILNDKQKSTENLDETKTSRTSLTQVMRTSSCTKINNSTSRSMDSTSSITTSEDNNLDNLDNLNSSDQLSKIKQLNSKSSKTSDLKSSTPTSSNLNSSASSSNSCSPKQSLVESELKSSKEDLKNVKTLKLIQKNEIVKIEPESEKKIENDESNQKSQSKVVAIYDNNLTNEMLIQNCTNTNKILYNTQPAYDSKSKSCERIDLIKFKTTFNPIKISNTCYPNRFSYVDNNNKESNNSRKSVDSNSNMNTNCNKHLSYSKSLKLQPKTNTAKKIDNISNFDKISDNPNPTLITNNYDNNNNNNNNSKNYSFNIATSSQSYKVLQGKASAKDLMLNGEPIWKELAFKKQNAWNMKNLENTNQYNTMYSDRANQDSIQLMSISNDQTPPNEGKVKSMIRDLHKKS